MNIIEFYNAISKGDLEKIKEANKQGKKFNLNNNMFYANQKAVPLPLIIALEKGHYELAKYLIDNGADLNIVCKCRNKTPKEYLPKDFFNLQNLKTTTIDLGVENDLTAS